MTRGSEAAAIFQRVARPTVEGAEARTVCGTSRCDGGSDGVMNAPARATIADVIMPSPPPRGSFLRSDHRKNMPIAATTLAMMIGINSRRSSLAGIHLTLHRCNGMSLPESVSKGLTEVARP
jgi:hypothetical protein